MFFAPRASRAPDDDFWYQTIGVRGPGGGVVSADTAMRQATVYACVRVYADTLGQLPLILYRRLAAGGKVRAMEHPLYRLLARQPNEQQTSLEWRSMLEGHVELRGNAYAKIYNRGAIVSGLVPMHPDRVKVELLPNDRLRYTWTPKGRPPEVLNQDQVLHLRGLETDGLMGLNPIEAQRETLSNSSAAEAFGRRFFENDGTPGGWVEHPSQFKDKEAREKWRAAWQEQQAGRNHGKVAVLEYGMKYHEVGMKMVDAQYLENRKANSLQICQIFRMPPHKVQILDEAKWANIEQQSIDFVTDSILPRARNWEQRLDATLLTEQERDRYFFEFNLDGLLRGDSSARSAYYKAGVNDGWMTRNEVRDRENLNPLPGLDEPLQPLNMARVGAPGAAPPADGEPARAARIEQAAAQAVVMKEAHAVRATASKVRDEALGPALQQLYRDELVPFIERALAVPTSAAERYAEASLSELAEAHLEGRFAELLTEWRSTRSAQLLEIIRV